MDVDVDGHRKFGIIAPLNFAIISSGRTDGGREGGKAGYSEIIPVVQ